MRKHVLCLALPAALSVAAPIHAAPAVPVSEAVGKFGFDWLKPESAACRQVSISLSQRFRSCRAGTTASFTGKAGHLVCKVKGGEYLLYDSKARCAEELDTMQANAP